MYLLNTEPLTILSCPLNTVFHVLSGPVPRDAKKKDSLLLLQFFKDTFSLGAICLRPLWMTLFRVRFLALISCKSQSRTILCPILMFTLSQNKLSSTYLSKSYVKSHTKLCKRPLWRFWFCAFYLFFSHLS
jgi:hypothetical protein